MKKKQVKKCSLLHKAQWEKGLLSRVTANKKIFETAKRIAKRAEEQYRLAKKAEARSLQVEAEMKK